jgi:hypothetical protein
MYDEGDGVPQDYAESVKWHRLAAQQGFAKSQEYLGIMYRAGKGVPQDYAEAAKWTRLAAQQGEVSSQMVLGLLYAAGLGVPQDYIHAHLWLNLASVSGDAEAVKNRDNVAKKMSPQQIAEAQKMARVCTDNKFKGCN